jgi:3-dehydroquinate synthase
VDKKAEGGETRFIVIETPGQARLQPVPDDTVARVLERHVQTNGAPR